LEVEYERHFLKISKDGESMILTVVIWPVDQTSNNRCFKLLITVCWWPLERTAEGIQATYGQSRTDPGSRLKTCQKVIFGCRLLHNYLKSVC